MEVDTDTLGVDESFAVYGSDGEEIRFDFSSHVKDTESSEEDAEAPCLQPHESALIPFTHSYLGELHDVRRGHPPVIFSQEDYPLPMIQQKCLLFPGQIVPVKVGHVFASRMRLVANGESQLAGYVVSVWCPFPYISDPPLAVSHRGCIARVLQISGDGQTALIQGVCVCTFPDWVNDVYNTIAAPFPLDEVLVSALPETCPPPGEARSHLDSLANSALADFRRNFPLVGGFEGDPLQVAYWLAANTPLPTFYCELLLREPPLELLRAVGELSDNAKVLTCRKCGTEVADAKDLIQVVDQGPCPVCINDGRFMHKIICLGKEIRGAHLDAPRLWFTWFPGYASQNIYCACGEAILGWVFTAFDANMPIQKFWGLDQDCIWLKDDRDPADASDEANSASGSGEDVP